MFGTHKYSGGAMGIAELRHDGFTAMKPQDERGEPTTEILKYQGEYVSVNTDCPKGELTVEVLDKGGDVILSYSAADCVAMAQDRTKYKVRWKTRNFLDLPGDKIRLRFISESGELCSFWITGNVGGESHGHPAVGVSELKCGSRDN